MRKLVFLTAAALFATTSLAGCSSGPSGDGRDCLTVPDAVVERIADGANNQEITPTGAGAVRSESFEDATIVALAFSVDGDEETGVWAVAGTLDDPGSILSIDAVAAVVTDWPNEMNGTKFDITEDGAAEALDCLAGSV